MAVMSGAMPSDHRSSATSSQAVGAGSGGGSAPVTTPGSRSAVAWAAAPASHTRARRPAGPTSVRPVRPAGQAVEGPGRGQRLQLGPGHPGPAHQVLHARTTGVPPRSGRPSPRRRRAPRTARAGWPPRPAPGSPLRPSRPRSAHRSDRFEPGCRPPRFTSGRRTTTPWRLASATRLWGDQNPMGWAFNRPAVKAAG